MLNTLRWLLSPKFRRNIKRVNDEYKTEWDRILCIDPEEYRKEFHPDMSHEDCFNLYYPIRMTDAFASKWNNTDA